MFRWNTTCEGSDADVIKDGNEIGREVEDVRVVENGAGATEELAAAPAVEVCVVLASNDVA